jgi:hypothetical protein
MPVTNDKPAPYAPAKSVLEIIERHRARGLPLPINADNLARASVPETLVPRVIQSLRALDLVSEDGQPTPTFESIRLAPEAEYKKRLEDWLKGTYADIFTFVDPTKDGEIRIRDAFRGYLPVGQQVRMVTLFQGLCVAAGLIAEKPQRAATPNGSASPQVKRAARRIVDNHFRNEAKQSARQSTVNATAPALGLPPALAGLLASLPSAETGWTQPKRNQFVKTLEAVLDFCIPILAHDPEEDEEADEEAA